MAVSPDLPAQTPINVGFLWHMHQPTYRPGQTIFETENSGDFSFSVVDVHNQRTGPYTTWPRDAVQSGLSLPHLGAQVSFSGSLIRNLNDLEAAGVNGGQWSDWQGAYQQAARWRTSEGNPRLDLVNFGFNHPLMPLLDTRDIRMQVRLQKHIHQQSWGPDVPFSKGIFPPETAFATRIIPALQAEGIEWAIVDSIHLERAVENYPHTDASNLYRPNRADQINPAIPDEQWVQLNNLWAPSRVAAPFAYRPHHVQHVDPATGEISKIVAVPAARYEGNEDGRGGFGALQYEQVMSQYARFNNDPNHPMFVLLHHDGDNFGGGSEAYYHGNFNNLVSWASNNPGYDVTTIQDYLDRYPVAPNDVVHIESGSWAGADNGDPEFKRWLGDPGPDGWSPDRNSWAVLTAAKNRVFTADDIAPAANLDNIINGAGTPTERAWHTLLQAQASDHWYWDGTEVWDSNVTLGSNQAVAHADQVISGFAGQETTAPSVFVPQRESYNPGGEEFGVAQANDFEVWTYAYDVSGLSSVQLKYRVDGDGRNPLDSIQNETYAGGDEVGDWLTIDMTSSDVAPPANILDPTYRALRYGGLIEGLEGVLVDYYVEAVDALGNLTRTDIQHVYVGEGLTAGGDRLALSDDPLVAGELFSLTYDPTGGPLAGAESVFAHYGYDDWSTVVSPDSPLVWDAERELWTLSLTAAGDASQFDIVFNDGAGAWDNNGGQDWRFEITGGSPGGETQFVLDGALDAGVPAVASADGRTLHVSLVGGELYLATEGAGDGADVFLLVATDPENLAAAPWGKSWEVAEWVAFLADESDNGFFGWFDAEGGEAASGSGEGVLEGVLDLLAEFGVSDLADLPETLFVAAMAFSTPDGGALVESTDWFELSLFLPQAGDYDGDGDIDNDDFAAWAAGFNGSDAGDGNGDQIVSAADYVVWRDRAGAAAFQASAASVPEPTAAALLALGGCLTAARRRRQSGRRR